MASDLTHDRDLVQVKGHTGTHSYSPEETAAFSEHFNIYLSNVPDLAHLLPIKSETNEMLSKVHDGLLLAKFINVAVPDTIDARALNKVKPGKDLSLFQINENQTLVIASAKGIGIKTTNIGPGELTDGASNPIIVLGLVWQLVKLHLLTSINLKAHPELVRLLGPQEELADLLKLPPEQLLLRWFNYHLANAGSQRRVANLSSDVKDGECYTILLNQISPNVCSRAALQENDLTKRAAMVLQNAAALEVKAGIKPADIVSGNPRLNLLFTAAIFNQCPGLDTLTEEEIAKVGLDEDDVGDSREERAFRMWINSLGIEDLYVNNLYEDSADGLVLLKTLDTISPGCVNWKQVEMKPGNKFKKVSNCNYAVDVGKALKFSLVGVGGVDINSGNKKLILAMVWQMMRLHTLSVLKTLGGDKKIDDDGIIAWSNERVLMVNKCGSKPITSFKDPSLHNSAYFMDLLASVNDKIIDYDLIHHGSEKPEELLLNARYAISVARKLGAVIFLLPEDIVEVKPKMIMTFVASIMAIGVKH